MKSRTTVIGHVVMLLIMAAASAVASASNGAPTPLTMPDIYANPGRLISLGHGRQLNLRCEGSGTTTVMLEAGSHTDSSTLFRLQPLMEKFTRVCAYDRAGYGFSSEGPLPRNLHADVADLHALIYHANLQRPLVLVGHSLGTNIVRQYAQRYPRDVRAMVLLDPPAQDIAAFAPAWAKTLTQLNIRRFAFIGQCETGAEKRQLDSPPPALKDCLAGLDPLADAKVNAATRAWKLRPAFWRTLLSELQDNVVVFGHPVPSTETHGAMPLLVMTAANTYADAPVPLRESLEAARDRTQAKIVATSSGGRRQLVQNSSHDIQLDQPRVVAQAFKDMLRPDNRQQ